jgi:3-hydroxyacyl-CoA dehydrogenase/enoyl-CoA hydratase/3-hydroxybutyryl-CoA epimerase/3-hydroxyacyl-CoA dehydrogenase/enoyl-CoA hydratase/3-hydroxybutyryl-CoA epimerase/enoyl-CoA isomerase
MAAIERAATGFGMAKGPLQLLDEIGLDTALAGGLVLRDAFPDRTVASPILIGMVKAGRLGCKSGAGFFRYGNEPDTPGATRADPLIEQLIAKWARPPRTPIPQTITARLFLPIIVEATRILEEGKVRDPRDVDRGMLFGLGFPEALGGLLYWADSLGAARVVETLRSLDDLGERVRPTPMLLEMAASGKRFYEDANERRSSGSRGKM